MLLSTSTKNEAWCLTLGFLNAFDVLREWTIVLRKPHMATAGRQRHCLKRSKVRSPFRPLCLTWRASSVGSRVVQIKRIGVFPFPP